MIYLLISLLLLLVIVFLCKRLHDLTQVEKKNYIIEKDAQIQKLKTESDNLERSLVTQRQAAEQVLEQTNKRISEQEQRQKEFERNLWKIVEAKVEAYRNSKMMEALTTVEREAEKEATRAKSEHTELVAKLNDELKSIQHKVDEQKTEVGEWQKKREAINQDILRQRALEEKQDFYRVVLSEEATQDISLLMSIRQNLHHRENLDKMIYDNYVSKPVLEMVKRVLSGSAPSGIYKVTRLKTGEIYIGKSTDVKARWQQHAKTAFNCGTIAHSILHTTMEKDGLQNFTFELIEEVPKDKLGEREKFWIDFYGSKQYGLNEKAGG